MKRNFIIAVIVIGLTGLLIFALVNKATSSRGGGASKTSQTKERNNNNFQVRKKTATDDTAVESLAGISAITAELQEEQERARKAAKQNKDDAINATKAVNEALEKLNARLAEVKDGISVDIDVMEQRLKEEMKKELDDDFDVGQENESLGENELIWITPRHIDEESFGNGGAGILNRATNLTGGLINSTRNQLANTAPNRLDSSNRNRNIFGEVDQEEVDFNKEPVFTIPVNATLTGATNISSVIGRVPVGNNIRLPVRFKMITGSENLLANGVDLPEIKEAIWSGYAFGDRVLECVRGVVDTVTFVFKDGTIATIPDPNEGANGTDNRSSESDGNGIDSLDGLGWISDSRGNCVKGEYITNAPENLTKLFLAGVAAGAADGLSRSQVTIGGTGFGQVLSGSGGEFVLGNGARSGLDAWADYIQERAREDFDVVFVESGRELVINITNQIEIDYDFIGRRVKYFNTEGVQNDLH